MSAKIKSILLSSNPLRKMLEHRNQEGAFTRVFQAIDRLNQLHTSLETLFETGNPTLSREGNALAYKGRYDSAMKQAQETALAAVDGLSEYEGAAARKAFELAGLNTRLSDAQAQEIRAAIRALPSDERDKVLREAATKPDPAIIVAVRDAPSPLLVGGATVPQELMLQMARDAMPELDDIQQDVGTASEFLQGAVNAFTKAAEGMRDPQAEARAEQQRKAIHLAEQAITSH